MNAGKNRLLVALGSIAAIGVLLAAFVVVWLLPHGPQTGDASTQTQTGNGQRGWLRGAHAPREWRRG